MTGTLWRSTAHETFSAPPFQGAATADLVVIGGGYTGCAAALEAAEQGASVVLLEAEEIGHGGSGRNVGLVNAGLWLPPRDVEAALGPADGAYLNKVLAEAPDVVFDLIHSYQMRCEATRNGTLHCAHDAAALEGLRARHDQLADTGAPVRLLNAGETRLRTGAQGFAGALFDARAGTIHPLDYVRGLARAAVGNGAQVHENAPVIRISHAGHWNVETAHGRVSAARMIVATNAYHRAVTGVTVPDMPKVHYFQVATEPLADDVLEEILPGGEGCWDSRLVMSSFRIDRTGRLILGGMGRPELGGKALHHGWARRKIRALFPDLGEVRIQSHVHGRISMPGDKVPKILTLGAGGCAIFGYAGRGIGPGTVFGQSVADALLNGDEGRLPIPAVKRVREPGAALKSLYFEAGARAAHLVDARSR